MTDSTPLFRGRITDLLLRPDGRTGRVSVRGARASVALDLVPEAAEGDYVLVHAGVAVALVHPEPSVLDPAASPGLD